MTTDRTEAQTSQVAEQATDRHTELETLMQEIDNRIARFCALTGANGKTVKKRWRDLKKNSRVPPRLPSTEEQVEKAARDYFVDRGYVPGDGTWEFEVTTISRYGSKHMMVMLAEDTTEKASLIYQAETATLESLYADAIDFFTSREPS